MLTIDDFNSFWGFLGHPVQSRLYHESTYHHENKACSIPLRIKKSQKIINPIVLMYTHGSN